MGGPHTDATNANTADHSYQSPTGGRIICRCCLSEEDELTDYLPLDAATSTSFPFCNDDDAAVSSDSSAAVMSTATLLDCLNGCTRIGATLEDAELPLHICLDCCQALEASCEFIRCVQNADKILRRKLLSSTSSASARLTKSGSQVSSTGRPAGADLEKEVTRKAPSAAEVLCGEVMQEEEQELLSIKSLSLMDLTDDSQMNILDFETLDGANETTNFTTKGFTSMLANRSTSSNTNYTTTTTPKSVFKVAAANNRSDKAEFPEMTSSINSKTAKMGNLVTDEIPSVLKVNSSMKTKDCEIAIPGNTKYKFIPPILKNVYMNQCKGATQSILTIKVQNEKAPQHYNPSNVCGGSEKSVLEGQNRNSANAQFATLINGGRKFIVSAAIVNDLLNFHNANQGNSSKSLCMFCIFACKTRKELERHLVKHLGPPCYSCTMCNFKCRFRYYLMKHLKRAHNRLEVNINYQNEASFPSAAETATKFFCDICQRYFNSFVALKQHHHIDEDPCFRCRYCAVQETDREQLMEHFAREHKVFIDAHLIDIYLPNTEEITPKSPKTTTSNSPTNLNKMFLSQFIKFDSKEDCAIAHLCQFCGRSFKRRFHMLKHIHYSHSKDRTKNTDRSAIKSRSNQFARQQSTRHLLHTTQAEHQYKCNACRCVFRTEEALAAHGQQHSGTQFECTTCRIVFAFEFELKYHMRTHNGSGSSPRSEYHVVSLRNRLKKLKKQKKQTLKFSGLNNTKHKPIQKRRLSLVTVTTAKSLEEGSVDSPESCVDGEDMPYISPVASVNSYEIPADGHAQNSPALTSAHVMLPQVLPGNSLSNCHTPPPSSSASSSTSIIPPLTTSDATPSSSTSPHDKHLSSDSSDQAYLNDFDLTFLDSNDDFWLQLTSF